MEFKTNNSHVRRRLISLVSLGIMFLVLSLYGIISNWTPESSLVQIKGTHRSSNIYVYTVSHRGRYGMESRSQISELIFYLNEHAKKFVLAEDIGNSHWNEEFGEIKSKLELADSVKVWIKKSEANYWEPQVFQVEVDQEIVMSLNAIRFKNLSVAFVYFLFGIGSLAYPAYVYYPVLLRNWRSMRK